MSHSLSYLSLITVQTEIDAAPMSLTLVAGLLLVAALVLVCWDRYRLTVLRYELAALRRAALRDPLTGLANRPGLTQAWTQLAPTRPYVALIDLDGFKPVNDTHGHAAGDIVLTAVAGRLRTIDGVAARLGGDEFAVLICGPNPTATADRLAQVIAAPIRLPTGITVTVTASIGLAPSTDDLSAALAAADAAMYRAKITRVGVAVFDPRRDDHTTPATNTRPVVRVRNLTPGHGSRPVLPVPDLTPTVATKVTDRLSPEVGRQVGGLIVAHHQATSGQAARR